MAAIALIVLSVVVGIISFLPTITINADAVTTSSAYQFIRAACYFIPVNTVTTILTLIVSLWVLRIIIAVIKMIWDLLPVA